MHKRPWRTNALASDYQESALVDRLPHPFSATVGALDGNALVTLVGDLDLNTASDLTRVLNTFIENGPAEVVLDFAELSFLDSTGISVLIAAQSSLNQQGRRLTIRSPRPPALKLFEMTGLTDILNVEAEGAKQRPPESPARSPQWLVAPPTDLR